MRTRLVVLGASGHAKVVIELLEETGQWEVTGCVSASGSGESLLGHAVLGGDELLPALLGSGIRHAFVAIGENRIRQRASRRAFEAGFTLVNAVSGRAVISPSAKLGRGVAIMAGAVVNAEAVLEDGVIVNTGATVDHDCRIGAYAHVAPGVNLAGRVEAGEGAFVGIGSRVIPGVRIGAWAVVGAGAAVVEDVPDGATVVGVPARVIKRGPGPAHS